MPKSLSELAAERAAEVAAFLRAHPEFEEAGFEQSSRERRWVGDKNLTTYPIDPMLLAEVGEDYHRGAPGVAGGGEEGDGAGGDTEYREGGLNFQRLFREAGARTDEQHDVAARVTRTLRQLSPIDVSVIERRVYERMTLDAIAAEDGVTRQAIIKRLDRAIKHFQEAYGE